MFSSTWAEQSFPAHINITITRIIAQNILKYQIRMYLFGTNANTVPLNKDGSLADDFQVIS